MRTSLFVCCVIALLALSAPAQAQLRTAGSPAETSVRLYDQGKTGFSLDRFFTPEHFRMSHSFEMNSSSFGGGSSQAMYTNSMSWQFSSKLAARLDVAAATSLNGENVSRLTGGSQNQVFIRNMEVAYRPSKNVELHLSMRRNPYAGLGGYGSPYGYGRDGYNGYSNSSFRANYGSSSQNLFWNHRLR